MTSYHRLRYFSKNLKATRGSLTTEEEYRESAENQDLELRSGEDEDYNLISSQTNVVGVHMPVYDIDGPWLRLVPSRTPGHFHLYVDKTLPWPKHAALLRALVRAGLVEKGYESASLTRGMTLVRKPPPEPVKPLWKRLLAKAAA